MSARLLSLATGYGGLDMAVEATTGARLAYVSDVDLGACTLLAHRYPDVTNLGDMTRIDWASLTGPVDVIAGGTPCQDVSLAGRRAGMREGTRSNLWVAMRDAVACLRPSLVIWENVDGVQSAPAASRVESCPGCVGDGRGESALRALGRVLGDLAALGYDAQWCSLRAADVGACHLRRRTFVVAHPAGQPWRFAAATEAPGGRALAEPRGRAGAPLLPTPRASLGASATETVALLPTPSAGAFNDSEDLEAWEARRQRVKVATGNGNGFGTPLSIAVRAHPDGWGDYAAAIARHEQALGRPAPAPTEPGRNGAPRLAPRFVEWMMMLPNGWVTGIPGLTRSQQLRMLGNGVVPAQAEAALAWLSRVAEVAA